MPWCDNCEEMVPTEDLTDEGACPKCDEVLEERRKIPWHFKFLFVATVIYLGYRAYQGIGWLVHHV
jgi:uncharacterized paraquat-inducible protein A